MSNAPGFEWTGMITAAQSTAPVEYLVFGGPEHWHETPEGKKFACNCNPEQQEILRKKFYGEDTN